MAILNYSTKISVDKTCNEITKILVTYGASKIVFDYEKVSPGSILYHKGGLKLY